MGSQASRTGTRFALLSDMDSPDLAEWMSRTQTEWLVQCVTRELALLRLRLQECQHCPISGQCGPEDCPLSVRREEN